MVVGPKAQHGLWVTSNGGVCVWVCVWPAACEVLYTDTVVEDRHVSSESQFSHQCSGDEDVWQSVFRSDVEAEIRFNDMDSLVHSFSISY